MQQVQGPEGVSLVRFMATHKGLSAGGLAVIVLEVLGPRAGPVSDSTSCSQWGSANQTQQAVYAQRYPKEYGSLRGTVSNAAGVEAAINAGCVQAFESDSADTVNVVQAIKGHY